jgi:hypothetical protein
MVSESGEQSPYPNGRPLSNPQKEPRKMHVESHPGSKKNAGLLRAYAGSFMALLSLTAEREEFLGGISVVESSPDPNKEAIEDPDEKAPAIADLLLRENPPEGMKFRSGGMFASHTKLGAHLRMLNGEIAEHQGIVNSTGRKLYRNLGKGADVAMLQAAIRLGYRPPEVKAAPQKGA